MDPITIGAFAVAAFLLFGRKKKKPVQPGTGDLPTDGPTDGPTPGDEPTPPKPPSDGPKPGEPAHVPSNVIGGGWTWDDQAIWPTEGSIAGALVTVSDGSYAPGGGFAMPNYHITDASGQGAVRAFQRDWNEVIDHWTSLTKAGSTKPTGKLTADGWIGKNTWKAMRWVFKRDKKLHGIPGADPYLHWADMVKAAKALP